MCVACLNIRGTLVHHETKKPVPLMPQLLRRLQEAGWQIKVTTRYEMDKAEDLLSSVCRTADILATSVDIAAGLTDKAAYVRRLLDDGVTNLIFIDDNPTQVKAVQKVVLAPERPLRNAVVRVFGFLGSRKSVPKAYAECINAGAKYALTAIELAERLESWFSYESILVTLTLDGVIELIPGLQHPMSAAGGESQLIPGFILARWNQLSPDQLKHVWMNIGMVQCDECMFYWMVRLALAECGHPKFEAFLEGAHDVQQYMSALKAVPPRLLHELGQSLNRGLDLMAEGVKGVGIDTSDDVMGRMARNKRRVRDLGGGR
jgi:hypothetical protein